MKRSLLVVFVLLAGLLIGIGTWMWPGLRRPHPRAEWPEFRGPTQDGHSTATGLPTEWSTTKNVLWKINLPGKAWSSPVVAESRIYLTNATAPNDNDLHQNVSLRVTCLEAAGGKVLWDQEVFSIENPYGFGMHDKNSYASPTPVFDEGKIYAHFGHFGSACLDTEGHVIWKTQEPTYKAEHGAGGCPIVIGHSMIFNCDGVEDPFVAALDTATGKVRWKQSRDRSSKSNYSLSTPLVIDVQGKKQIVTVGTHIIQGLDPETGHPLWYVNHKGYCVVPRPVYAHGLVYFSTGFDAPILDAVKPEGLGSKDNPVWQLTKNAPLTPSLLAVGDDLYAVSDKGIVSCLDAQTGQVQWQERVGRATSASPLYADGKIYVQDEFGKGYVLQPGRQFKLLATNDLEDPSLASYAVHEHTLLIRTLHALWCIGEAKKGS